MRQTITLLFWESYLPQWQTTTYFTIRSKTLLTCTSLSNGQWLHIQRMVEIFKDLSQQLLKSQNCISNLSFRVTVYPLLPLKTNSAQVAEPSLTIGAVIKSKILRTNPNWTITSYNQQFEPWLAIPTGPDCSKGGNAIHWINLYLVDSTEHYPDAFLRNSNLSVG